MAIYTSNHQKPAPDIAAYMLSRWGESENFFKEIMSLYNFNYHPGYDLKELEEQPLINDSVDLLSFQKNCYNMVCLMSNKQQYLVFGFSKSE